MAKISYKTAGVDIKKADQFIKNIKAKGIASAFGSMFDLGPLMKRYKNPVLVASSDGVGTKLKIAQKLNIHHTVGIDLVAMNVNDIVCLGAKPLFFLDYIACGKVDVKMLSSIMKGIKRGLDDSGCRLLGGETAEMPGMYKRDEYDLAGFCVGIADKKNIIDGRRIRQGDIVIGLASGGLHSNGFSLVRKALGERGVKNHAAELLKPTRIYVKPILSLLKRYDFKSCILKGIAHNTGGAFYEKLTKVLPARYGMVIDKSSWRVPRIFKMIQQKARLSDKEMYSVFNMGVGMIVIVDRKNVKRTISHLQRFYNAQAIGMVTKASRRMNLV